MAVRSPQQWSSRKRHSRECIAALLNSILYNPSDSKSKLLSKANCHIHLSARRLCHSNRLPRRNRPDLPIRREGTTSIQALVLGCKENILRPLHLPTGSTLIDDCLRKDGHFDTLYDLVNLLDDAVFSSLKNGAVHYRSGIDLATVKDLATKILDLFREKARIKGAAEISATALYKAFEDEGSHDTIQNAIRYLIERDFIAPHSYSSTAKGMVKRVGGEREDTR